MNGNVHVSLPARHYSNSAGHEEEFIVGTLGEPFFGRRIMGEKITKPQGFVAGATTMSGRRRT
jgi:hypothetical protein